MAEPAVTVEGLRAAGRRGSTLFAACCAERLRALLRHVPSGAPPLVAGVALTELWRVLEGIERPDPRRLQELSTACWTLVEIEPVEGVRTEHLEALVAAAHEAIETYLSGDPRHALETAKHCRAATAEDELDRQARDAADIAAAAARLPQAATKLRERAEKDGARIFGTRNAA
jgi:hypothetical protein